MANAAELDALERQIDALKAELRAARQAQLSEVGEYEFAVLNGRRNLSELFLDKNDLIVVHNMGRSCVYCTSYGDALNGIAAHLQSRTALAMVTPDAPADQLQFTSSRDWQFHIVSDDSGAFTSDMGFKTEEGLMPGFSCFYRHEDGRMERTGFSFFCPGDEFNPIWPYLSMLKEGAGDWSPKYKY